MSESNKEIIDKINRYQDSLERYNRKGDDHKMIHYLKKLRDLPINTSHLQETGVGRTVSALKKHDGSVGDAANDLVYKWKEMVMKGRNSSPEREIPENKHKSRSKYRSHNSERTDNTYKIDDQGGYSMNEDEKSSSEGYESIDSNSDIQNDSAHHHEENSDADSRDLSRDDTESKTKETANKHNEHSKRPREYDVSDNSEPEYKHLKKDETNEKSKHSKTSSSDKHSFDDKESNKHKDKSKERHHHKSSKERKDKHSDHQKDKSKTDSKSHKRYRESSEDNSHVHKKHKKENSHHKHNDREESSRSKNKKDEPSTSERKEASKHESKSKHKERSSSDKHTTDNTNVTSKEYKKKGSSKHEQEKNKCRDENKGKSEHKSSKKEKESSVSSSSKHKDKDKKKSANKSKETKPFSKVKVIDSIDSGSGASFAEALGMCAPVKPKTPKKKISHVHKPSSTSKENETDDCLPPLLKEPVQTEPLDINISNLLPPITPNYRPIGNATLENFQKKLSEEEALSRVIYAKNQRTKVFSGNKTAWGIVPSLFDLCTRILQDNIDALEYTGGVPYHILKPIIEKANPDQLYMLEHHNPYIIDDSDELWQLHCMKDFRNKKREELESWRDMYMRCLDEREAKLKALTANIKQAQDKSLPVRTTKLAYIDDYVKPPRNILRQQAKHGTAHEKRPSLTPAARSTAVANTVSNATSAVTEKVPNPGARAAERSSQATLKIKPKKAPLMAKTLSFLKNRFKR